MKKIKSAMKLFNCGGKGGGMEKRMFIVIPFYIYNITNYLILKNINIMLNPLSFRETLPSCGYDPATD